ncbi:CapA family protein [Streptomyces botrytidirepellens]|uniref:CapA family protein n=1 Tax=Streptomyces botrytidirepellens TaxID=2486417 RepID=A0A3M8VS53_9ACTN|nr:CapA family protein [Streptomyces botrytidirepellens]RNG20330.1 CapA family protein [Streptomyces botrytidirepellens]
MFQHRRRRTAIFVAALLATATACGSGGDPVTGHAEQKPSETARVARAEPQKKFTLVATGDLLAHASVIRQARADSGGEGYDFHRMLIGAAPVVAQADLAICHMETVYGANGGPFTGYPTFKTPPQIAGAIKRLGYDSCSTASNHTLDAGTEGVTRTLDALDKAGVRHAGSARSARESTTPALMEAGGAKVAQLAYAYGTNGIPVPEGKPWIVNLIDAERIIEDARAARRAGADVVVVSTHWGTEWQEAPDKLQLSLAKKLTASRSHGRRDIDLIIGTHAHVPQAYEKVNGTWVVYGMGDQVAGVMPDERGQMGSAARFTFTPPTAQGRPWQVAKAEFIPHAVDNDPISVVNLPRALEKSPGNSHYTHALSTIREAVLSRGAQKDGLTMGR